VLQHTVVLRHLPRTVQHLRTVVDMEVGAVVLHRMVVVMVQVAATEAVAASAAVAASEVAVVAAVAAIVWAHLAQDSKNCGGTCQSCPSLRRTFTTSTQQ